MKKKPEQIILELTDKIKELELQLQKAKENVWYGLKREDKPEQFEEYTQNALPVLKEDTSLLIDNESNLDHLIIEGDNYHSLSVLSYTHKGKIDLIYIDPPYNTGNKDFVYNDNYVDKEDSYRHSKWLSFMNKRLRLAKELLSDEGVIFISIDDNEQANLKLLCDQIFGEENFIAQFLWKRKKEIANDSKNVAIQWEYIVCYSKTEGAKLWFEPLSEPYIQKSYKEPTIEFPLGKWRAVPITVSKGLSWGGYEYSITTPSGAVHTRIWAYPEASYQKLLHNWLVYFWKKGDAIPQRVMYLSESLWQPVSNYWDDVWSNKEGKNEILSVFWENIFETPKPPRLMKKILGIASNTSSIILDFFAGSWTIWQAVLELNKEDWWKRQFILCNYAQDKDFSDNHNICRNITYERVKRVMQGYTNAKGDTIEGIWWGNLRYYTTAFIKKEKAADDLRQKFIYLCDELLCIKENTFTVLDSDYCSDQLKCYYKNDHYTIILYDLWQMDNLQQLIAGLDGQISLYLFSLSKEAYEEELLPFIDKVTIENVPDDILETYHKIF